MRMFCHQEQPCAKKRAAQQTDQAVVAIEQIVKAQDEAIIKIVTGAHKEVAAQNEAIRESVQGLTPDGVAVGLMALLSEYRRERGD